MISFLHSVGAELSAIRRNPSAISTMAGAILLYAAFYPQPYLNEAIRDVPTIVIDQDNSAVSRELARRVDSSEGAKIVNAVEGMDEARAQVFAREAYTVFVIPRNFERDILAGRQSPIAAYGDGSYFLLFRQAIGAIAAAARTVGIEAGVERLVATGVDPALALAMFDPLPVTAIPLFNPQGGYASYVVPAALVLILQQTLLMGIIVMNAPRKASDCSKVDRRSDFPKVTAYVLLYLVWSFFYLVVLPRFYELPRLGAITDLLLLVIPFLTATSFLGLFLSRVVASRESGTLILVALGIPLFFVAGAAWPIETISPGVRFFTLLIPSTSAIRALVQINQMGASFEEVRDAATLLWALTALFASLTFSARFLKRWAERNQEHRRSNV